MQQLKISIIIAVSPNANINYALNSLRRVDYIKKNLETIIVEGHQPAQQRNEGVKLAKGEIVYFLDNDSRVQSDSLNLLAKDFSNIKMAAVGGPSLTSKKDGGYLNQLIGAVLETYFGALRMRFRYSQQINTNITTEYHLIGANLAIRKKIFLNLGGYDEKFYPNEETDFLRRLIDHGYKLKYNERIFVYRSHRKNIIELIKQFFRYGKGRMMQIIKIPKLEDIIFILPIGFVLYLGTLIFLHELIYLVPIFIYFSLSFLTSFKASLKYKRIDYFFIMPLIFPLIHISYSLGLISEGIKFLFLRQKTSQANSILRIKFINL